MSFALTKANFYQIVNASPSQRPNLQVLEFTVTRANTDTDLDLFDASGTFWTAVGGSGIGLAAKTALTPIFEQVRGIVNASAVGNSSLLHWGGAPSATVFSITNDGTYPVVKPAITLVSGSGPTTLEFTLVLSLNNLIAPVEFSA